MTDSSSISKTTNALSGLFYFFIITTGYFGFKIYSKDGKEIKMWSIIYILLLLIGQFYINLTITNQLCGVNQYISALSVTIIPWGVIFGLLNVMLMVFPGWLSPFSNTFGYLFAKLAGIENFFSDILNPKIIKTDTDSSINAAAAEALEHIYGDKSLLLNEITSENIETFWSQMTDAKLLKASVKDNNDIKTKLLWFINLKTNIAMYIWYILTGALITSVSYNYIMNNGCNKTSSDMIKQNTEYINNENANENDINNLTSNTEPRIYSSYE